MAGRDGTSNDYKEGVDFEWVKAENGNYKTRRFFTKAEKEAMKKGKAKPAAKSVAKPTSAPSKSKRPNQRPATLGVKEAIDRTNSGPSRRMGPRRKKEEASTATSITTPKVTTSTLPAANNTLTLKGYTWEEYKEGNNLGRLRAGLPMGLSRKEFMERAEKESTTSGMAKGGMVKKSGYAKGGMVKANCGASMKPTQKSARGK